MKQIILLLIIILIGCYNGYSQNPYASIGKKAKTLTLSDGKYNEFFANDTLVEIGSVVFNTITGKVVGFVERDTMYSEYSMEPEVMSRWLSPDPLADEYTSFSPYNYTLNNPILYIDPDGREVVNPSKEELQTVVTDLNKIYKDKYGFENAFSVEKRVRTKKVRTNDWSLFSPSSWGNAFEEPEYEEVEIVDYKISKNEDFDWETDKYTAGMSDLIDAESSVKLDIVEDNGLEYKTEVDLTQKGLMIDYGGGYTVSSSKVFLSEKLSKSDGNNKKSKWTYGAVAIHELLYHIHPLGRDEKGNPNTMRDHYGAKNGKTHGPGGRQMRSLKKKKTTK